MLSNRLSNKRVFSTHRCAPFKKILLYSIDGHQVECEISLKIGWKKHSHLIRSHILSVEALGIQVIPGFRPERQVLGATKFDNIEE